MVKNSDSSIMDGVPQLTLKTLLDCLGAML